MEKAKNLYVQPMDTNCCNAWHIGDMIHLGFSLPFPLGAQVAVFDVGFSTHACVCVCACT